MTGVLDKLAVRSAGFSAAAPALRWQVLVDWFGDGLWNAENVDDSDDLAGVRWRWGRVGLPVPEFVGPATLELTLKNPQHRYTPGSLTSPLAGHVAPGREVWLRAGWLYDDFETDTDAAEELDGRATTYGAARWEALTTPGNGFHASGGEVRGRVGRGVPSAALAVVETGDPLATLIVRYRRVSDGMGGFGLRCASLTDFLRLRFTDDMTLLERVSGASATVLATGDALAGSVWYELEIVSDGGGVAVYATNLESAGVARSEILSASDVGDAPQSGRHGIWHGFRNSVDRWGPFHVGRSLFSGSITAIEPDDAAGVCRVSAVDASARLDGVRLFRQLAGGLMRSGAVARAILDWAGLDAGDIDADAGRVLLTGGPRPVWDVSAGRALRQLQREEHGLVYVDGLGRMRLEAAAARSAIRAGDAPTDLARASVGDTAGGSTAYASGMIWDSGTAAVESEVTFRYFRPVDNGRQQIWTLPEPLTLEPQSGETLLATTDEYEAITGVETPAGATDFEATANADGTGDDVTDSVTVEPVAEADSAVAGRGVALRIRNDSTSIAYLQRLEVYAGHCWRASAEVAYRADVPRDSPISRVVECWFIDNYAAARETADARLNDRSVARPQLEIALPLVSWANLRAVVEARLSDVVAVQATTQSISGAWLLEGMEIKAVVGSPPAARWWLTQV